MHFKPAPKGRFYRSKVMSDNFHVSDTIRAGISGNCKPPPIARKTSVFLAPKNRIDYDAAISKKTRQEKQGNVVIAISSFLTKEL
jgi:hypothetical protein